MTVELALANALKHQEVIRQASTDELTAWQTVGRSSPLVPGEPANKRSRSSPPMWTD